MTAAEEAATAAAPLLGGQIVGSLGYGWLFGLSALASLAALPVLLGRGAAAPNE